MQKNNMLSRLKLKLLVEGDFKYIVFRRKVTSFPPL